MIANLIAHHQGIASWSERDRRGAQYLEEGHVGVVAIPGAGQHVAACVDRHRSDTHDSPEHCRNKCPSAVPRNALLVGRAAPTPEQEPAHHEDNQQAKPAPQAGRNPRPAQNDP